MIAHKDFDGSRGPGSDRGNAAEIAEEQTETSAPKRAPRFHEIYNNLIAISRQCQKSPFFPTEWGTKIPAPGWKWRQQHINQEQQLVESLQYHGIAMDFTGTGHVAIDCDTAASYPIFIKVFGKHPSEVQTPQWTSGGKIDDTEEIKRQVLFALPSGLKQARIAFSGNAIDVRGDGCYSVMPTDSPHPKTGAPYYWLKAPTQYAIAQLTEEQLEQFRLLAEQSKGSTKKSDRAATPEWTKTVQGWGERYRQFKAGELLAGELTPTEYCDFVLTPLAGWQPVLGYGSRHGFLKKIGDRYVTSPDEYRVTSSGESITIDPERIAPDMAIYRAHDRGIQEGHYMSAPLLVLKRRGIDNPTFALKVAIVNEIAEAIGAPKYHPELIGRSNELTEEEIRNYLLEKLAIVEAEVNKHRLLDPTICESNTEAAEIVEKDVTRNIAVRADCGTGKSKVIKANREKYEGNVLNLYPRRTLVQEGGAKYRLNHYDNLDRLTLDDVMKNGLSVCLDSLDLVAAKFPQWQPRGVNLDEIDSTLSHINHSSTEISHKRSKIRAIFSSGLKNSEEITSASHDLTGAEVVLLEKISGKRITVINVTEKVPPRSLAVHDCGLRTFLERIQANIVANDDGRPVPAAHCISSDSRKFTRNFAAFLLGRDSTILAQGDSDEIEFHNGVMAELTSEVAYMLDRIEVLVVNANTVHKPEVQRCLNDPTGYALSVAARGKTLIVIASPSISEGVSFVPHGGQFYVYEVLFSDHLSKQQVCQQVQRFRGAAETHLWLDPRLRGERDIPVYTIEEMISSERQIERYAKEDPELQSATLNYLRSREIDRQIYEITGMYPDRMTDDERGMLVSELVYKLNTRWTREDIINALYCTETDPWLEYEMKIQQRNDFERRNYQQSIVNGLLEQGFYLVDYAGPISETDDRSYLEVKSMTKEVDTGWFWNGLNDPAQMGDYDNIKDELAHSDGLEERELLELQGAQLGHEFPGMAFTRLDADRELSGTGTTYAAKLLAVATSSKFSTDRNRKRLAREIADEHRAHLSLVDNRKANQQAARHQFLLLIGFFDALNSETLRTQYTRESEELEALVKAANKPKAKKMAKALRVSVPKVGARKKYLRFFGTLLKWMGLSGQNKKLRGQVISKYPQDHDQDDPSVQFAPVLGNESTPTIECFAIHGLERLDALCQAHTRFLAERYDKQCHRFQSVRDILTLVRAEENRLANHNNSERISVTVETQPQPTSQLHQGSILDPVVRSGSGGAVTTAAVKSQNRLADIINTVHNPPMAENQSQPRGPATLPCSWVPGAMLRITAATSRLYEQLVELVEWVYHENFAIWYIQVRTQAGEVLMLDYSQAVLACDMVAPIVEREV